jgi:hypothetical protein
MTAQILHIRDYKSKEERELEIDRMCLAAVEDALNEPVAFNAKVAEYNAPDGDCA